MHTKHLLPRPAATPPQHARRPACWSVALPASPDTLPGSATPNSSGVSWRFSGVHGKRERRWRISGHPGLGLHGYGHNVLVGTVAATLLNANTVTHILRRTRARTVNTCAAHIHDSAGPSSTPLRPDGGHATTHPPPNADPLRLDRSIADLAGPFFAGEVPSPAPRTSVCATLLLNPPGVIFRQDGCQRHQRIHSCVEARLRAPHATGLHSSTLYSATDNLEASGSAPSFRRRVPPVRNQLRLRWVQRVLQPPGVSGGPGGLRPHRGRRRCPREYQSGTELDGSGG